LSDLERLPVTHPAAAFVSGALASEQLVGQPEVVDVGSINITIQLEHESPDLALA